jgi:hypothetical protein
MKAYLLALGASLLLLPAGCGPTGGATATPVTAAAAAGSPAYQQGYADGCKSGENSANNIVTEVKNDAQYQSDPDYKRGWNEAHDYCFTGAMNRKTRY